MIEKKNCPKPINCPNNSDVYTFFDKSIYFSSFKEVRIIIIIRVIICLFLKRAAMLLLPDIKFVLSKSRKLWDRVFREIKTKLFNLYKYVWVAFFDLQERICKQRNCKNLETKRVWNKCANFGKMLISLFLSGFLKCKNDDEEYYHGTRKYSYCHPLPSVIRQV